MVKVSGILLVALVAMTVAGCEPPDPNANTPTSGRLILFVDEMYAPLVRALADTFALRSPNAKIEVHSVPARMAVEELLRADVGPAARRDTTASIAIVIGRRLLKDEQQAIDDARVQLNSYVIAHDGLVFVVPIASAIEATTMERLRVALRGTEDNSMTLDSANSTPVKQFTVPNQNSSTFMELRRQLLNDSNIAAPVRYFASSDSVVEVVVAEGGVGILPWYRAHRDSARIRPLRVGHTDSLKRYIEPVRVHPATLVTNTYPLKQPIVGFTLAPTNSLANGFLTWLARGQDAQYFLVYQGLQPENVKLDLVMPEN